MTKLLITADWHLGLTSGALKRTNDILETVNNIVDIAISEKVDYFIHAGDVYHKNIINQELVTDMIKICNRLENSKILRSFFLVGNHDDISREDKKHALLPLSKIMYNNIDIVDCIRFFDISCPEWNKRFIFIPHLCKAKSKGIPEEVVKTEVLKLLDRDSIIFFHGIIEGAKSGTEEMMLSNKSFGLPNEIINHQLVKRVFSGHIHKPQDVGSKITIIGAPVYVDASEAKDEKGVIIYNV